MQLPQFEQLINQYANLSFERTAVLLLIGLVSVFILQAWANSRRAKSEGKITEGMLALIGRQQTHMETMELATQTADEQRVELRNTAHRALADMAVALTRLGELVDKSYTTVADRVDRVDTHVISLAKEGPIPLQGLIKTVNELMLNSIAAKESVDRLQSGFDTAVSELRDIALSIELSKSAVLAAIDRACEKQEEKRRTDSKPIVILPLNAEDDPDKNEATG